MTGERGSRREADCRTKEARCLRRTVVVLSGRRGADGVGFGRGDVGM